MIGYRITRAALEQRIDAEVSGWRTRAAQRTAAFQTQGTY